jgi:hypothetical protein
MFAGRKEGRGRRDGGRAGDERRGGGETAAAVSNFVSSRTTVSEAGHGTMLVDVGAEVADLKAKGHQVSRWVPLVCAPGESLSDIGT